MADSDSRTKAINRARKLLAMAEDASTTEEERQAFAARAAEIMARHDLSEALVKAATDQAPDPVDMWEFKVTGAGGHGKARAYAAGAIAQAYGAEVCYFSNDTSPKPRRVCVVASRRDIDTLRMLLPMIAAAAEHAAAAATRAHLDGAGWLTPAERRRESAAFRRSYLWAYGHGVADQIHTRRQQVIDELVSDGSGAQLVLADRDARVTAEFGRQFPKLGKARRDRSFSRAGWAQGRADGRAAPLADRSITAAGPDAIPEPRT